MKNNNNKNNKNNSKEGTAESVKGQRAVAPLTLITSNSEGYNEYADIISTQYIVLNDPITQILYISAIM